MAPPPQWALRWLGRPWVRGVYECTDFVAEVLEVEFKRRPLMPRATSRREGERLLAEAVGVLAEASDAPRDGDPVLMRAAGRRAGIGHHLGLYCAGGVRPSVLHCMSGAGSCLHPLDTLSQRGLELAGLYRWL